MSHRDEIDNLAREVAEGIATGTVENLPPELYQFMVAAPQSARELVGLIDREINRASPDDALIEVYADMFAAAVEGARYEVERGHGWAEELVDEIRRELLELGRRGRLPATCLLRLANALIDARLTPGEALTELLGEAFLDVAADEEAPDISDADDMVEAMVAAAGGDEHDLREALDDFGRALPPAFRVKLLEAVATSENPTLRDAMVFSLLDPAPEVRYAGCRLIAARASPATVSPVALRRMIAVRNWLPEADRPHLDGAIRSIRQGNVDCAPWAKRLVPEIIASHLDGARAQSVFAVSKDGNKFTISGLLLKQGVGIPDAWSRREQSKSEVRYFLRELQSNVESHKVSMDYVRTLVSHFLAVGQDVGEVPPVGMLELVEAIGLADCQPAALSTADLSAILEADIEPALLEEPALVRTLAASDGLTENCPYLDTWYEDDAAVEAMLDDMEVCDEAGVLDLVLEPRRAKWAEQFLWTALWLKQKRSRQGAWRTFFVVGRELSRGRPLGDIGIMRQMARATALL